MDFRLCCKTKMLSCILPQPLLFRALRRVAWVERTLSINRDKPEVMKVYSRAGRWVEMVSAKERRLALRVRMLGSGSWTGVSRRRVLVKGWVRVKFMA